MKSTRRHFLQGALATATLSSTVLGAQRAPDANDQIRIGVIGCGVRGKYLIGNLPASARVVAICDCATSRMADTLLPRGPFVQVLERFRTTDALRCNQYQDYRKMIDKERLDAVIIATPDHHHTLAAMLVMSANLDVYVEYPLTVSIQEGRQQADLVTRTGRVLQVGSQQRSMELNQMGCEFIRQGGLGKIVKVELPNYPGPIANPAYPAEPVPNGLNWDLFLGPTAMRAHNRHLWIKDAFKVGELTWRGCFETTRDI